ncbi:MAG TPA: hypothetical protein VNR87_00940 [Flavisolibacter sp.]|nr:hypothetical protein [Flavisolibacter sp.]
MTDGEDLVPEHETGVQTNTESSIECSNEEEATEFFEEVKHRLLHVGGWHGLAGPASATFQLTDEMGNPQNREARIGDHFKIDIPGPGTITGGGDDWVRIEMVENSEELAAIRVRPATNPKNDRKDIAHFFSERSTSSFIVKKQKNKIIAGVYGRNEKPNTNAEQLADKIRNTAVATGAASGLSKLQWKSLANGLVKKN